MLVRRSHRLLLIAAIATLSHSAAAQYDDRALLTALADTAVVGASRGDAGALGMLGVLLDLPEPWASSVLAAIETSNFVDEFDHLRESRRGSKRSEIDRLRERVAAMQGAGARPAAMTVALGAVNVELDPSPARWLFVDKLPDERGELLIQSADCTPEVVAFPADVRLPARPLAGQVRLSAQLATVPVAGPVALRVKAGNCEDAVVSLQLSHGSPRVELAVVSVLDTTSTTPMNRFPELAADQLTVISLERRAAQTFSLQTQPGFVYAAYAAPLAPALDPALIRADRDVPGHLLDANDDDGWQLGARLEYFVGSGRTEHLAVTRTHSGRGSVAVLVHTEPVALLDSTSSPQTPLIRGKSTWRRITLPAGDWAVATRDLTPGVDPVVTVFDAVTGALLAQNDDGRDGDPASSVLLRLDRPGEIVIRLDSLIGEGSCTLEATQVTGPASERHPVVRDRAPSLSA